MGGDIPNVFRKLANRLARKLPRIDDHKSPNISKYWSTYDRSIPGALAQPVCQFLKHVRYKLRCISAYLLLLILAAGCGKDTSREPEEKTPEVSVVRVTEEEVPLTRELPGRIVPIRGAVVRARTTGIVIKQLYQEGSVVKAADPLFILELSTPQTLYDAAQADLNRSKSLFQQARVREERYKDLVEIDAVSQQDYDDAVYTMQEAEAAVQRAEADLNKAAIEVSHTFVLAPIDGWIGPSKVTEGGLVDDLNKTELALIQQLDPIYFDFIEVTAELLELKAVLKQQGINQRGARIQLILEDGSLYEQEGKVLYSDVTVNQGTGTILARAHIPNPDNILLPGMFVRGRIELAKVRGFLVPQQAVILGPDGKSSVWVVNAKNQVEERSVQRTYTVGHNWLITEGLKEGEQIVMEGFQKITPGVEVKVVP